MIIKELKETSQMRKNNKKIYAMIIAVSMAIAMLQNKLCYAELAATTEVFLPNATLDSIAFSGGGNYKVINYNTDYAGSSGQPFPSPEWKRSGTANPICYQKGSKPSLTIVLKPMPILGGESVPAKLKIKKGASEDLKNITLTGSSVTASVTCSNIFIEDKVANTDLTLSAEISYDGGTTYINLGSLSNKLYVTYDVPSGVLTQKRIEWCTNKANGLNSSDSIANAIHNPLAGMFDLNYNCCSEPWKVLDAATRYDCQSLSACMKEALSLLGISSSVSYVYGSRDTDVISEETRVDPIYGEEKLLVYCGGWNNYEACCVANNIWYPGGIYGYKNSALEILRAWLSVSGVYQAWVYRDGTGTHVHEIVPTP